MTDEMDGIRNNIPQLRRRVKPVKAVKLRVDQVRVAFEDLVDDTVCLCLTTGAWSLYDVIVWALERCGPSRVLVSAWHCGRREAAALASKRTEGEISELVVALDPSFLHRPSAVAGDIVDALGDSVWCAHTHAKVVSVIGRTRGVMALSSANLNFNPRVECYTVDTSFESAVWLWDAVAPMLVPWQGANANQRAREAARAEVKRAQSLDEWEEQTTVDIRTEDEDDDDVFGVLGEDDW